VAFEVNTLLHMRTIATTDLYFMGDLHGNFRALRQLIKKHKLKKAHIIQVGDFGVGYQSFLNDLKAMEKINALLENAEAHLYVMRGNHDNPAYFRGPVPRPLDQSCISFVEDYTVLEINQMRILLIGGAISIDRKLQREGVHYWKEEVLNYDEKKLEVMRNIDLVVTHSAPNFAPPYHFGELVMAFARNDASLVDDLHEERALLSKMYDCLKQEPSNKLSYWLYGHFHSTNQARYEDTEMVLIGLNELVKF